MVRSVKLLSCLAIVIILSVILYGSGRDNPGKPTSNAPVAGLQKSVSDDQERYSLVVDNFFDSLTEYLVPNLDQFRQFVDPVTNKSCVSHPCRQGFVLMKDSFPAHFSATDTHWVTEERHLGYIKGSEPYNLVNLSEIYDRRDCVVIDVGSNSGIYSQILVAKGCRAIAIDLGTGCIAYHSAFIVKNNLHNRLYSINRPVHFERRNVTILNDYVSCRVERLDSLNGQDARQPNGRVAVNMSTIVLSELIPAAVKISWLKIDVEGFEPYALRGALNLFRNRQVQLATVEITSDLWPVPHDKESLALFRTILSYGYRYFFPSRSMLTFSHSLVPGVLEVVAELVMHPLEHFTVILVQERQRLCWPK